MQQDQLNRNLNMNRKQVGRRTGEYLEPFAEMEVVPTLREVQEKNSGRPAALSGAEHLLMTLKCRAGKKTGRSYTW